MDDQTSKVDSTDARQASMSRVVTQDEILANLVAEKPALEAAPEKESEVEQESKEEKPKVKQTAQERIIELANKRRDAEKLVENTKRENDELKARLKALEATAPVVQQDDRPNRSQYLNEDQYIEALTDWKVTKAVVEQEQRKQQARLAAEMQEIDVRYTKSVDSAKSKYDDFVDVVSAATTDVPPFLEMALKESDIGGELVYYLSKHEDEAKKLIAMRPVQAVKYLDRLERDLLEPAEGDIAVAAVKPKVQKKAPEPITPIRGQAAVEPGQAKDFAEYRARRKAEQRR
jgi:hypothetical protein